MRLIVRADETTVTAYLGPDRAATVVVDDASLVDAVRAAKVGPGTYLWAAGEAGMLTPVRRHWRGTLGLPEAQVHCSGYWRRGVAGHDHHTPLDASDPE